MQWGESRIVSISLCIYIHMHNYKYTYTYIYVYITMDKLYQVTNLKCWAIL